MLQVYEAHVQKLKISILAHPSPCITNPASVCYQVGYYEFTISLPASTDRLYDYIPALLQDSRYQ